MRRHYVSEDPRANHQGRVPMSCRGHCVRSSGENRSTCGQLVVEPKEHPVGCRNCAYRLPIGHYQKARLSGVAAAWEIGGSDPWNHERRVCPQLSSLCGLDHADGRRRGKLNSLRVLLA